MKAWRPLITSSFQTFFLLKERRKGRKNTHTVCTTQYKMDTFKWNANRPKAERLTNLFHFPFTLQIHILLTELQTFPENYSRKSLYFVLYFQQRYSVWKMAFEAISQCLKITQNVAFEFFNFGIFHQFSSYKKLTCLVTMFDRKLQVSKTRQIDHF